MTKTKYLGYKTESLGGKFFVHVLTDGGNLPLCMPSGTLHEKMIKRIKQFLPQLDYSSLKESEPKMRLQLGKRYKTKSGLITDPLVRSDEDSYPFQCPATLMTWTNMGQHNVTPNQNDIIEKYTEPETIVGIDKRMEPGDEYYKLIVTTDLGKTYTGDVKIKHSPRDYIKANWSHLQFPEPGTELPPREKVLAEGGTEFSTGAVRSADAAGVRYDLITPIGLRRIAETYKEGYDKYGASNWEKGMPINDILNHGIRHIYEYLSGDRSEDHLAHAAWNLLAAMHMEETHPNLTTEIRTKK